ncbi:hypothetical protein COLO4_10204 [Corchorus olitorius]|uniref:Uncharacterized protein n=1 Tax=Corchorus olitorius TaxID=93759 RepID=A0A1R3K9T9_9ROSI|nr:hypothetical protein COLO4_10204 [Corchorus olitorius]
MGSLGWLLLAVAGHKSIPTRQDDVVGIHLH